MKSWIVALMALLVGGGVGGVRAWKEFQGVELFVPYNTGAAAVGEEANQRIIAINGSTFNFGRMQQGTKMEHAFVLKNIGDVPVEIWVGESSCTCTVASMSKTKPRGAEELPGEPLGDDTDEHLVLKPSETTEINLKWEANAPNPTYFQTAEIRTNHPDQPVLRLEVQGYVQNVLSLVPDSLQVNNVSVETGATSVVTMFSIEPEFPEIQKVEFTNAELKDFFTVEVVDVKQFEDPRHLSGKRFVIKIEPGLPVGTSSQNMHIALDMAGENNFYVPITAKVESEVSILGGRDYHTESGVVRWGVLDRSRGRETTLYVIVKGDHREQVKLEIDEIKPADSLAVEVLPVKDPAASTWTIPIKVSLKPDGPPATMLGGANSEFGVVRMRTGHPVAKELQFKVQFAVN
ncbi:MAG: DUF1573 domain-containing protein [Planctomycetales bacterium]|nr:DUF1573 domain-containing protein [Planctomycetales bacterium]